MGDEQPVGQEPDHGASRSRARREERRRAQHRRRRQVRVALIVALVAVGGAVAGVLLHHSERVDDPVVDTTAKSKGASSAVERNDRQAAEANTTDLSANDDALVDAALERLPLIKVASKRGRRIALTFDDGPSPYTPKIMRILNREKVPATFFWNGNRVLEYTDAQWKRLPKGDFVIGNHTWAHANLTRRAPAQQETDIGDATYTIEKHIGHRPRLFRPPYGAFNHTTLRVVGENQMLMVLWSVDSQDYQLPGAKKIANNVVRGARPGGIVLLHDGGGKREQTIAALPTIIKRLKAKHYRFVTVPDLLRDPPPLKQPAVAAAPG